MPDQRPTDRDEPHRPSINARGVRSDDGQAWGALYTLLAEGLKHPDERLHRDVREGRFAEELTRLAETLSVSLPAGSSELETAPETRAAFDGEYIELFEGLKTPYASPIESVYRPWHGGPANDGLLSGPAAADMRDRYDAAGVSVPAAYAPDHLALLLEYAGALHRAGADAAYLTFVEQHFEWLPALRRLTDAAAADAPFHGYCVEVVCETVAVVREREGLTPPAPGPVAEMCDRARSHAE